MVEKTFCDMCGKDTTKDVQFDLELYDLTAEKSKVKIDLCEKCAKKVETFLKGKQ